MTNDSHYCIRCNRRELVLVLPIQCILTGDDYSVLGSDEVLLREGSRNWLSNGEEKLSA